MTFIDTFGEQSAEILANQEQERWQALEELTIRASNLNEVINSYAAGNIVQKSIEVTLNNAEQPTKLNVTALISGADRGKAGVSVLVESIYGDYEHLFAYKTTTEIMKAFDPKAAEVPQATFAGSSNNTKPVEGSFISDDDLAAMMILEQALGVVVDVEAGQLRLKADSPSLASALAVLKERRTKEYEDVIKPLANRIDQQLSQLCAGVPPAAVKWVSHDVADPRSEQGGTVPMIISPDTLSSMEEDRYTISLVRPDGTKFHVMGIGHRPAESIENAVVLKHGGFDKPFVEWIEDRDFLIVLQMTSIYLDELISASSAEPVVLTP